MSPEDLLFLDFESASKCDLSAHGLGRYLRDPTTRPFCFSWRLRGPAYQPQATALWQFGEFVPVSVVRHLEAGGLFVAHNAPFDFHFWNEVLRAYVAGLPEIQIEQVRCSAARARYNGLPGSLEGACRALGLPVQKDVVAAKAVKELFSHPEWTPQTHPELFATLYRYGVTDTDAMIGLWDATVPLPEHMQREFELDMRINARGFGVDVEGAKAMEELKTLAEAQIDLRLAEITAGGIMAATEVQKLKEIARNFDVELDDAGKETVKALAARDDIPDDLKQIAQLRLDASRSPKKAAAVLRAHVGGRMHHATVFHGALSGRSTAMGCGGVQLLNVARPRPGKSPEDCEAYLEAAKRRDMAFLSAPAVGPALAALADAQRPLFMATRPGHTLVGADLSGIEARLAPWLANDEQKLRDFEAGRDPYKVAAAFIYGVLYDAVTKDQRQVGKVADLALGYGGGDGAFVSMAANYGVHLPPEQVAEIVRAWRAGRLPFETWWSVLEYAVLIALDQPGREVRVPIGRGFCSEVVFVRDDRALRMRLPSGRTISYHNARLHMEPGASAPLAIYDKPEGYVETLDRKILSNNMTQGLARDLFWAIMLSVDPIEPIVHHVYDELILEVPTERAELRLAQLLDRMAMPPSYTPGLPLAAAGYVNPRWRKD